jgi:asparagine synthase (glutamine-hydrolysing)
MCGISGFISHHPLPAAHIKRMNDLIRHRGPDDEGFVMFRDLLATPVIVGGSDTSEQSWRAEMPFAPRKRIEEVSDMKVQIAFGHRRLSILDLSSFGHQPMSYQAGCYWITYNGEIYNYIELRSELESFGHHFLSQSDTEIILAAYVQWGKECLHRFNGMWAFAIYDTVRKEVFLSRDRFGVKPLYYWVAPNGAVCFASEIKQFTVFPGWNAQVNPITAYDFLVKGQIDHTDETLFAGVYQLQGGYSMLLKMNSWHPESDGRLVVNKWYNLEPDIFYGSYTETTSEFRELLKDSVRLQLRADVPVGSCLSGGLDSSSIVCLMDKLLTEMGIKDLQKTFSACSNIKRFDERDWINEVVKITNIKDHYVYPSLENLFKESSNIIWHQDGPFESTSIYAQWNVFRLASQNNVKVMLDGQGADEQLAGYHVFFSSHFADLFSQLKFLKLWSELKDAKRIHGYSEIHSLENMFSVLLPHQLKTLIKKMSGRYIKSPAWLDLKSLGIEVGLPVENMSNSKTRMQFLSKDYLTRTSVPKLLHWEDRNSMAHSIESRVPFLDHRLVEFVVSLPDEFKLSGGITKRVMRDGMSGILPDKIRDRMDKLGFVTPEEIWVKEQASDQFRTKLQNAVDSSQGILSQKCLTDLDEMISGKSSFNSVIWRMINFGDWMETFSVKNCGTTEPLRITNA